MPNLQLNFCATGLYVPAQTPAKPQPQVRPLVRPQVSLSSREQSQAKPQAKPNKKHNKKGRMNQRPRHQSQAPVWVEGKTDDGHTYYYNSVTGGE